LPQAIKAFAPKVREAARDVAAAFKAKGGGDFLAEVGFALTSSIVSGLLGLDPATTPEFRPLISALMSAFELDLSAEGWARADAAAVSLREFWLAEIERRKADLHGDDIVAQLLRNGEFSPTAVAIIAENILAAGFETTANTSANGLLALIRNPEQMQLARRDATARAAITGEVMRLFTAAPTVPRITDAPLTLGGHRVPPGAALLVFVAAANRDPAVFEDPNRFDLTRPREPRGIGFGLGIHGCVGQWLAQTALSSLYDEIVQTWDHIELVGPTPHYKGVGIRMLDHLHLRVA
jgi:cytochrome P450